MTRIHIHLGLSSLILVILFSSLGVPAQIRDPLPLPDVLGYKVLKCDFHLHTVFSDGEVWPTVRLREAWRDGLDAIAIADHSEYNPHKEDLQPDSSRAEALIRPLAESLGIVVIPAVEIAEGDIHFNILFTKDANGFKGIKVLAALQRAREEDAFVFWNHPGWKRTAEWFPLIAEAYDRKLFQGMELVNGMNFYPEAYPWVDSRRLTILCNSDAHDSIPAATLGVRRPLTLVFARSTDTAGIREALTERRSAAWMGGDVWGPEPLLKALWENAVRMEISPLRLSAGGSAAALRLNNTSALPFKLRLRKAPTWLRISGEGAPFRGQSILGCPVRAAKDAPVGEQSIDIELEITNLHVGPERNLTVMMPLTLNVRP